MSRALYRLTTWLRWINTGQPRLGCGCPDDGRPTYHCMRCSHTSCDIHHADHTHPPQVTR